MNLQNKENSAEEETRMSNDAEKALQKEMENEVKMTKETTQEDMDKKEDSKKGLSKQQSDKDDGGSSEEEKIEEQALVISPSTGRKYLFGTPMDEQIVKLSAGPKGEGGCGIKRRTHRYGTKWLQLQKLPTVRARIKKKLMTEVRAKDDEKKGEEEKGRDGRAKHSEVDPYEDEERRGELKKGPE